MRRREFIAGTAITAALSFAKPVYAQTDARSPGIKRIAIVHTAEKPEGMTINGRLTFKAYFGELKRLGYVEGQNLLVDRQKIRTLIKRDFEAAYASGVDAILTPATPSAAFGIGEMASADPVEMYLNDVFTVTVNMAGLPGISVPAGLDAQGLPLGLQLIGRPFDEETLFAAAQTIENAAGRINLPKAWWA